MISRMVDTFCSLLSLFRHLFTRLRQQVADDIHALGVIEMRDRGMLLNCFTKYDIMHVKSWFYQEREVTE